MDTSSRLEELLKLLASGDLPNAETAERAIEMAQSVENDDERSTAFLELIKALVSEQEWESTETALRVMRASLEGYAYEQSSALLELATGLITVGQQERAKQIAT